MPLSGDFFSLDDKDRAGIQFPQDLIAVGPDIGHEEAAKAHIDREGDNDADNRLPKNATQSVKKSVFQ